MKIKLTNMLKGKERKNSILKPEKAEKYYPKEGTN